MNKALIVSLLVLSSCGKENENSPMVKGPQNSKNNQETFNSKDQQIALIAASNSAALRPAAVPSSATGSGTTTSTASQSAQVSGQTLAFSSLVEFTNTALSQACNGALAYEAEPNGSANLYLYTAAHCFEKTNPLGFLTTKIGRAGVLFGPSASIPSRYLPPFGIAQRIPTTLQNTKAEVLFENSKRGDVVRIFQRRAPMATLSQSYLPTCQSIGNYKKTRRLMFGAMAADPQGIAMALSEADVDSGSFGSPMSDQLKQIPNHGVMTNFMLENVFTFPGESGGPVWLIDGDRVASQLVQFFCLQGVITREITKPKLKSDGGYELEYNSFFSPIISNSGTSLLTWMPL